MIISCDHFHFFTIRLIGGRSCGAVAQFSKVENVVFIPKLYNYVKNILACFTSICTQCIVNPNFVFYVIYYIIYSFY